MRLQLLLNVYFRYFLTVRNGVFYGFFFVALGLWFAKTKIKIPFRAALAGAFGATGLMLYEVIRCSNTNMVFTSAPAAFFLFAAASEVRWKDRKLYPRLRAASNPKSRKERLRSLRPKRTTGRALCFRGSLF